jgi:alkylation response protein AidB-like acyl-CoA dehydrogenase
MTDYIAPLRDLNFVINELAGLEELSKLPGFEHATDDLLEPILEEAGRFAREVLGPTNVIGDQQGCSVENGVVKVPSEFSDAYQLFVEGGWQGLDCSQEYDGMGLPALIGSATAEMWQSANLALGLCPMLTSGAIDTVELHATDKLKQLYLPKMVSGEWTATMDLTEPQAGSDLAKVRTQAMPDGDHYQVTGTKIFITWGDHEMAENVVHLVLARLPDAPEGVRGMSLFLVPKFLVNDDGNLGERNDVYVTSVEHKLGIHASPTCVLNFGDKGGAVGYLVGKENRGLACMFTMMNLARLQVGIQGLAVSERSYQAARDYAKERVQGQIPGSHESATIIHHPDVRRMLMTMKSLIEAMRATAYVTASTIDVAHHTEDADSRTEALERAALLTPIVKGWMTEVAQELTGIGVQVHGGTGFVEETGVAQYLRDAKILTIYEGTTGIQANDLVGRKVLADSGLGMQRLLKDMTEFDASLASCGEELTSIRNAVATGRQRLEEATSWLLGKAEDEPAVVYLAAFDYLMLAGTVIGAWQMGRAAEIAHRKLKGNEDNADFYEAKIITARFYAEEILPRSAGYLEAATSDSGSAMDLPEEQF